MMTEEKRDAREVPDPEAPGTAEDRQVRDAYRLEILRRADACTRPDEVRALLEAEGLSSSHLSRWRQARAAGKLADTQGQTCGPQPASQDLAEAHAALLRENARLRKRLATAETIIEAQRQLAQLLGLEFSDPENEAPT